MLKFSLFAVKYLIMLLFRAVIACCFLIGLFSDTWAQKTFEFKYKNPVEAIKADFGAAKVIDKRMDTNTMGYVRINAYIKDITASPSVAKALENHYNEMFRQNTVDDTLLVVLHALKLEHNPTAAEQGTIYIYADFFKGANDQYELLLTVDSFYEVPPGSLPASMLKRYQLLMDAYITTIPEKTSGRKMYSFADAMWYSDKRKQEYPVYQTENYVRGIYKSHEEFLNQTPSIVEFKRLDRMVANQNVPQFYTTTVNNRHGERIDPSEYFAVYDKRWFKSTASGPIGMKKKGNDFYIQYRVQKGSEAGMALSGLMFGLMGAAAYQAFSQPKVRLSRGASTGTYLMKMVYDTGKMLPVRKVKD